MIRIKPKRKVKFGNHGKISVEEAMELLIEMQIEDRRLIIKAVNELDLSERTEVRAFSLLTQLDRNILNCLAEINKIHSS